MKLKTGLKLACLQAVIVACAGVTDSFAAEVFTWTDENGVVNYSDLPPDDGDSRQIEVEGVYMPGTAERAQATSVPEYGSGNDTQSVAQQRREQIAEDRDARKKEREETEQLCARHRQRVEQMEPARRVFYTDESGESVRMDDDQRMGLISESKDFIAKNCE